MVDLDIYSYAGEINISGYALICDQLKRKTGSNALLVLGTPGGDPHAGFRIARALQHAYGKFDVLVPRYCKSAGTLVAIGAATVYMADMSELGPLDIQVKKSDELIGTNSGLDITQAVNNLQQSAMGAFRSYLLELTRDAQISTKVAADISVRLTAGLFEPIFAQIDPMRLAEMQRAMEIAFAYGTRLNESSNNLRQDGLVDLVTKYPSHGFVIDRKEARKLFLKVERPEGVVSQLSDALHAQMQSSIDSRTPVVTFITTAAAPGATHENASDPGHPPASDPTSIHALGEPGTAEPGTATPVAANEDSPGPAAGAAGG
ncbi:MAG: SppA protein [Variovorax sp.]|nr:MAG: SppA protein [Variovorax sp.]